MVLLEGGLVLNFWMLGLHGKVKGLKGFGG